MKFTLQDIEIAKQKYKKAYNTVLFMDIKDNEWKKACQKANRLLKQYKRIKGLYFSGYN